MARALPMGRQTRFVAARGPGFSRTFGRRAIKNNSQKNSSLKKELLFSASNRLLARAPRCAADCRTGEAGRSRSGTPTGGRRRKRIAGRDPREARVLELTRRLKENGCRLTPQRLALLNALVRAETHPTAEELYARVRETCPTTSRATVYKTLETLQELGEVLELEFRDGSNRYDGVHPHAHPHMICTRCGRISDLHAAELDDVLARVIRASNFAIRSFRCDFFGLCADCQGLTPDAGRQ